MTHVVKILSVPAADTLIRERTRPRLPLACQLLQASVYYDDLLRQTG